MELFVEMYVFGMKQGIAAIILVILFLNSTINNFNLKYNKNSSSTSYNYNMNISSLDDDDDDDDDDTSLDCPWCGGAVKVNRHIKPIIYVLFHNLDLVGDCIIFYTVTVRFQTIAYI